MKKSSCARTLLQLALTMGMVLAAGASHSQSDHLEGALDPIDRSSPVARNGGASSLLLAVTHAGRRLVAVGERGLITTSDNDGVDWKQAKVPVSVLLTAVMFADDKVGWAVGHSGIVLRSVDGGSTWTKQLDGRSAASLVLEAARLKAAGGLLDKTSGQQLVDAERLVHDGADKPFLDLNVESERAALIVGAYGLAFRTEDGGVTWKPWQQRLPNARGAHLNAIRSEGSSVYAVGEQGTIYVSRDRGQNFVAMKTPHAGSFFGVSTLGEKSVVAYGLRGAVVRSDDAGLNWQLGKSSIEASINGGTVLRDGSFVVVSQAGNVMRSQDGGRTFVALRVEHPAPFVGVTQAQDGSLVLVGARGVTRFASPQLQATKSQGPT